MSRDWVVLYDAACGFCKWLLAALLRWDRAHRLRPLALRGRLSAAGFARFPGPTDRGYRWVAEHRAALRLGAGERQAARRAAGAAARAGLLVRG